jgi:hypothetical protein
MFEVNAGEVEQIEQDYIDMAALFLDSVDRLTDNWPGTATNADALESIENVRVVLLRIVKAQRLIKRRLEGG